MLSSRAGEADFAVVSSSHDEREDIGVSVPSVRPTSSSVGVHKVVKPIMSYLYNWWFLVSSFLDDFLLLAESPEDMEKVSSVVLDLFKKLGF